MKRQFILFLLFLNLVTTVGFTTAQKDDPTAWSVAVCDLIIDEYSLMYAPESVQLAAYYEKTGAYGFPPGMENGYIPSGYELYDIFDGPPLVVISFTDPISGGGQTTVFQYHNGLYQRLIDIGPQLNFYKNTRNEIFIESYSLTGGIDYYGLIKTKGAYTAQLRKGIPTDGREVLTATTYKNLHTKIEKLAKDNNTKYKNWQYVYAEFLEDHINSSTEKYFSLFDFDMDGIPELVMRTSVEYTTSAFFTVQDNKIRSLNWQYYTYWDSSPYVYYNAYYNIRGILAPYGKDQGIAPLFMLTENGDIDSAILLEQEKDAYPGGRFAFSHYGDGSQFYVIDITPTGGRVISDATYEYLKHELFREDKRLHKYSISVHSIYKALYEYEGYDDEYGKDETSIQGFLNFIDQ